MKKVFLSLPMSGRTQENIEFTIKAMTKKAKEILGEDVEVSHLANLVAYGNMDMYANPGMFNMVHATSKMIDCDYFMGFSRAALNLLGHITNSQHKGCILEEDLWLYSQRHLKNPIRSVNGHYTSYKRLPMVDAYNIQEFMPELDWRLVQGEIIKASRYPIENIRGARSKVATIDDIVDDGKEEKDLTIPYTTKDNKED